MKSCLCCLYFYRPQRRDVTPKNGRKICIRHRLQSHQAQFGREQYVFLAQLISSTGGGRHETSYSPVFVSIVSLRRVVSLPQKNKYCPAKFVFVAKFYVSIYSFIANWSMPFSTFSKVFQLTMYLHIELYLSRSCRPVAWGGGRNLLVGVLVFRLSFFFCRSYWFAFQKSLATRGSETTRKVLCELGYN